MNSILQGHEKVLLAAMMNGHPDLAICAADIGSPVNREIFHSIQAVKGRGDKPVFLAVQADLDSRDKLEYVGGRSGLCELIGLPGDEANINFALGQVLEASRKRSAALIAKRLENGSISPEQAAKELQDLNARSKVEPDVKTKTFGVLANVEMKPIIYLSKPLWQRGSFTLVTGKKNSGKSSMLVHEAARVTRGELGPKDKVIWIALGEDSLALDVRPRLEAVRADTSKVIFPDWRLELPRDVDDLKRAALEHGGVGMIVIDPISGAVEAGRNTNMDNDVRATIGRLNNLAEELDSLVVGVRHLRKSAREDVLDAVMGSSDWVNIPRAVIACAKDNQDENVCHIKVITGNRMPAGSSGLQFRLEPVRVLANGEPVVRAVLLGESNKEIGALLSEDFGNVSKSRLAKIEILDRTEQERELSGEGLESDNLIAQVARQFGLSAKTVRNGLTELGPKGEGLVWSYPEKDHDGKCKRWLVKRSNAARPESLMPLPDIPEATS